MSHTTSASRTVTPAPSRTWNDWAKSSCHRTATAGASRLSTVSHRSGVDLAPDRELKSARAPDGRSVGFPVLSMGVRFIGAGCDREAYHTSSAMVLCRSAKVRTGNLPFLPSGDIFRPIMVHSPRIEIKYCTQCRWLLRAAWMAQELLTTFPDEIGELALVPGTGGVFEVRIGDEMIWSRVDQGRLPDIKELKQLVRDRIAPAKDLGHSESGKQ